MVLERLMDLRHKRSVIHCDNTPSVSWATRMSTRGNSPTIAHRVVRGLAMRQRRTTHRILHAQSLFQLPEWKCFWPMWRPEPSQLTLTGRLRTRRATIHLQISRFSHTSLPISLSPRLALLEKCHPHARAALECDLNPAGATIKDATVDTAARAYSWRIWSQYAHNVCNIDPFFRLVPPLLVQQQSLLAFAARVRTGCFGHGWQVGHQTVEKALRHVGQTQVLAGFSDLRGDLAPKS
eukprot:scaffold31670_cov26-Attheya_sp.AAC.1